MLFLFWAMLGVLGWLLLGTIVVAFIFAWKAALAIAVILFLVIKLYGERPRRHRGSC